MHLNTPNPTRARASWLFIAAVTVLSLAATGCKKEHGADVVASVNGHAIMRSEMDKNFEDAQRAKQDQQPETEEQAKSDKLSILRTLIDGEIIEQRAAKMNLTATNEEVDSKLTEMKSHYTEEQFNQMLKESGRTIDEVRRDLRRSITLDKLLNKEINSKINVTDGEVGNFYNSHKADFNLIENKLHLAQIIVTSQPSPQGAGNLQGSKATTDADARKKIATLKAQLDSGADFAAVAANYSEDPQTASNGGDMGFVAESQLRQDVPVWNEVSKLKAGENTPIIPITPPGGKAPVGYSILRLVSREVAGQRDLNNPAVQQSIRDQLRNTRSQLLKSAYLEMLRDQAKVENYYAEDIFKAGSGS
ncbi:SurA N-terminal domain-containing protein [Terriglobus roseus]|uniref:peptidylprolyl isomerase n=1 Tax=Terriglobus roseus TaxID=392734 RepID=A0A1H4MQX2_9BACT|nr:SurA N-terminal domain-containing protein [Terriglobus roseus]SEB85451.1 peptidyl-prolyl cis-trans isomerase SurA [Terriglobus roseus]